ncbi:MAG TPA: hypothetical protein VM452_04185, partial [Caulifigura sp.]|nr:hypothetical protein [Caulifigura sp.]
ALAMLLGVVIARWLVTWHRGTASMFLRRLQIVLLTAVFLTPNLVVGFGYRAISINLLNHRWLNELLYFGLILFEFVPAAFWLLVSSPPPSLSAEAWHVAKLATHGDAARRSPLSSWRMRFHFWWRGCGETLVGPAALLFVLSFQESELAALMQVAGWPERLFTDHAKGEPPFTTLKLVVWPVLIQVPFLIPLVKQLGTATSTPALSVLAEKSLVLRSGRGARIALAVFGAVWIIASVAFVIGEPMWHLVDGIRRSGRTIILQPRWSRELRDAVLLAGTCVVLTWGAAVLLGSVFARGGARASRLNGGLLASVIPGLMGTLALGLVTAGFFQRFLPRLAYTPVPLILAECLWLWPRVILVRQSIAARTRVAAHQLALLARSPDAPQRARARAVWWRVAGRPLAGGVLLVFWWSYLEVMLPMILAMPGFEPAPKMMYNHLHFGALEALGVKLAMILSVPLIVGGTLMSVMKFLSGRHTR